MVAAPAHVQLGLQTASGLQQVRPYDAHWSPQTASPQCSQVPSQQPDGTQYFLTTLALAGSAQFFGSMQHVWVVSPHG